MPASTRSSTADANIWAVILAGGVGSRFWPVSTPARPKQLLPLGSERPLITDTVARIAPLVPTDRLRILTGRALATPILSAAPALDESNLLLEPRAKGTAPVLAWAAFEIARQDPDAVMASLHADHAIEPDQAFRDTIAEMARLAIAHGRIFTIGIEPSRPDTGYGYIRIGEPLAGEAGAFEVGAFVEKPDLETAKRYVESGEYAWNSGIFVWKVSTLLDEMRRHTPEIASLFPLLERGDVDAFFEQAPNLSIDEGVLERSGLVGVVRAPFLWDDVGAWDAVGRTRTPDPRGNVATGPVHLVDSSNCIVWSDSGAVVTFGVEGLVVVNSNGVTLVAPRDRTADLKSLLKELPAPLRELGG